MKFIRSVKDIFTREQEMHAPASETIALNAPSITAPHIVDGRENAGYLAGQLLVATPVIHNGMFHKSVIYLFAHNDDGAMGLIINQKLELVNYASLLEGMDLPDNVAERALPVYCGGPLERARGFVLHSADYRRPFTLATAGDLAVTASTSILSDIAQEQGPKDALLAVGYAGWSAGQLEAEIEQNSWITVPATPHLVFHTDNELKWATASKELGVDMAFFSTTTGHA
jgi:putative transcriptional regulator